VILNQTRVSTTSSGKRPKNDNALNSLKWREIDKIDSILISLMVRLDYGGQPLRNYTALTDLTNISYIGMHRERVAQVFLIFYEEGAVFSFYRGHHILEVSGIIDYSEQQ
jgi:hypothetical protein